jgi:hypothetical protein
MRTPRGHHTLGAILAAVAVPSAPGDFMKRVVALAREDERERVLHFNGVVRLLERGRGNGDQTIEAAQLGRRPCPRDRALWYCNIIEPNAWGADAVRAAFWTALQAHGEVG